MKYHRGLMNAILHDKVKIGDAVNATVIGLALERSSGIAFLDEDFQADDGYRRSQDMAKQLGLYRQRFCGCEYSLSPDLAARILKT